MDLTKDTIGELFQKSELIPAIAQDSENGEVLMLAYVNRQALELTLETGYAWYYSRSRRSLWKKGETSGHYQHIKAIYYDCDCDTLLYRIKQDGAACHTGNRTCFYRQLKTDFDGDK